MNESQTRKDQAQSRHYKQCVKEAKLVALVWLCGLIYSTIIFVCFGYPSPEDRPDSPSLTLGMPSWVFWGLFFPWFIQIGVTILFALRVIKDDEPLEEEEPKA